MFAPRRGSSAGVVTGLWDTVTRTEPRVLCHRTLRPRGICSGKRVWFVLIWSALYANGSDRSTSVAPGRLAGVVAGLWDTSLGRDHGYLAMTRVLRAHGMSVAVRDPHAAPSAGPRAWWAGLGSGRANAREMCGVQISRAINR